MSGRVADVWGATLRTLVLVESEAAPAFTIRTGNVLPSIPVGVFDIAAAFASDVKGWHQ